MAKNNDELSKPEDRPHTVVEDLLPLIKKARHSNDIILKADLARLSSLAATTLGGLPKRHPKVWTGWVGRTHFWRGRKAVLPSGQVVEVFAVLRGRACIQWRDPHWLENIRREVLSVEQLSAYRNPAAIWLGKLKTGCHERPSEEKAQTARRNGSSPCGPGKKRGRPKAQ